MSAIAWWSIPAVATLAAILYVSWRSRPRRPETLDSIEAREAFKRAMEQDQRRRRRRDRDGGESGA